MLWYESTGILRVTKSIHVPGAWWLHVECCADLGRYYRYLLLKWTCAYRGAHRPAWETHITVVRQEFCDLTKLMSYEGREISFRYKNVIETNEKHFWLNVGCNKLFDIREDLGLPREPYFPFHMTFAVMPGEPDGGA